MTRKNRVGRENIELCTGSDPYETTVASFPVQELVKILGEYRSGVRQRNCATETRRAARAIVVDLATLDDSVSDDALRAWLEQAPRIGTLL